MPQFEDAQKTLSEARAAQHRAQREVFHTRERLAQVKRKLREVERTAPSGDRAAAARLTGEKRRLEATLEESGAETERLEEVLGRMSTDFWNNFSDPRRNASKLDDDIPVLLFPLRLETRFKTVQGPAGAAPVQQLWVRVYPDECLIDTFEATLTETELQSATIFWREYFHAAGVESAERAAWRALVSSHGSGRATWIVKQFRPRNPLRPADPEGDPNLEVKPQSLASGEVILVASTSETLATAERAALAEFWESIWKADGKADLEAAALETLTEEVGTARAEELIESARPYNLNEAPPAGSTRASATAHAAFVFLPKSEDVDTRARSWTKAATASLLPERFVLLGYQSGEQVLSVLSEPVRTPLHVSPDPQTDAGTQFQFDANGNLTLGEDLRWMVDFDAAVARGMGFRVDLTPQQASGFDRLFVLGIRLSADAERGKTELQTLLQNHYFSRAGFALLPQGSATNNTEEGNSAYSRADDADASYDFVFKGLAQFTEQEDPLEKRDGQWFAESLGLDAEWLKQVPHAGGVDQREARAMNTALWPATLGYFMDTLLKPVFDDDAIYYTRWFFTRFVSGRGAVPAIRIGRQPYGILPATAFSRMRWMSDERQSHLLFASRFVEQRASPFREWLGGLKGVLDRLRISWTGFAQSVAHVDSQGGDPHQKLLDIVGLHPASVEFHQRYANTKDQEHNIAALWQLFIAWRDLPANELHNEAFALLNDLGYRGLVTPQLFDLFWKVSTNPLTGPAIQNGALSETEPLRVVTTNNRNYIQWLHEWARLSFDTIRVQDGFQNDQWPNALLFVLLKHALELGYFDAGLRVLDDAQLLGEDARASLRSEPHFFHVQDKPVVAAAGAGPAATASRYGLLYSASPAVTGDSQTLLVDYITRRIGDLYGTRYLTEQLRALEKLELTPTARLERLMAEHLDCCTYRLDAWMSGLVSYQLASMRYRPRSANDAREETPSYRKGIYLGAYGWLENVRPKASQLTPVRLDEALDEIFNQHQPPGQDAPLLRDAQNEGYIHAPSVNHAVTAAVLRNGYVANATPAEPELLKVNLSSERVRRALAMIEGIRNGQSLGALLGYQLERGLHDRHQFAECDQFIYALRLVFPLYTVPAEELPPGTTIQSIQARNVVNGLNLVRHVKNAAPADKTYPFGFPNTQLPDASAAQKTAINAEIDRLLDIHDALADLAVAEGVHQVVMGNYDRAAATMDAYGQATFPPIPDVVRTPRSGIALTHRVGLQFEANVAVAPGDNPRVKAEPAINRWLRKVLPLPARVGCTVKYRDAVTGTAKSTFVTQADLGLQPLDLLYIMDPDNLQARSELEDRIRDVVLRDTTLNVRPDLLVEIAYSHGQQNDFSFVAVAPMVRSLRALLLHSRPLRATDVALPTEAKAEPSAANVLARARVDFLPPALASERTPALTSLKAALDAAFPAAGPDTATILANVDTWLDEIVAACRSVARYGLPQTSFGVFLEQRARVFTSLLGKADALVQRWQGLSDQFDALMLSLPAIVDEQERIDLLLRAERLISTTPTNTTGLSSAQVLPVVQAKRTAFSTRKDALADLRQTTEVTIDGVLTQFKALLPLTAFDAQPTDAAGEEKQIVTLAADIRTRAGLLIEDIDKRIAAVQAKLAAHDAEASAEKRIQLLTEAARLVLGEPFVLVPSFALAPKQAAEWTNAYENRAKLLDHQKTVLHNDFAVDDWLYSTARVNTKLHHIENLTFLAEALGTTAPELRPVQFPYSADAPWMALEFPPEAKDKLAEELLLYTAHYSQDLDSALPQCGLLLDEWTEVIPAETETTGLAFQFDKPNAEPPQAILLATPPQFTGSWNWTDLVQTLHETLDMARVRAVEPQQIDQSPLSVFLPATILATTWRPITIAADLSVVNNYASRIS